MTQTAAPRRALRFDSITQVRDELDRLERAESENRLQTLGAWTPGQVYGHLAGWIGFCFDGYPPQVKAPAWLAMLLRLGKNKFLRDPLKPGVRIPRIPGGTLCTEALPSREGLARLRAALDRLDRTAPTHPNPIFGPLTHDEWIRLHLRHAELHLSFLSPQAREAA